MALFIQGSNKIELFVLQTYLQSTTLRLEEMRVKRRDAEQWMSHRLLPDSLKERIRRYEQYKWQETRGVDEENLIRNLPKDLRRDIKQHLCLDLLKRVSVFLNPFATMHLPMQIAILLVFSCSSALWLRSLVYCEKSDCTLKTVVTKLLSFLIFQSDSDYIIVWA